ncbi:hypothetical protein [Aquibacillus kalidii]|uniref:hypothetical protein n=1 Tax=Aquibacillus kalidii TaxID=2762597 RepID=UPI0016458E21|nr:hypothetical protein [Aquibacillus kalidii]
MSNENNDKKAEFFGMTVAIILAILAVLMFLSLPILISFGIIYFLSMFSFIEFHYYPNFWQNILFFGKFTFLNILVLVLSELLIVIDRKKKIKKLSDIGPTNFKEWFIYLVIFSVYMNVFTIYLNRLVTTIIGSTLIALCFITIFVFLEYIFRKLDNENEE